MPEYAILPILFIAAVVFTHASKSPPLAGFCMALATVFCRYGMLMQTHVSKMANNNALSISFSLALVGIMDGFVILLAALPLLTWIYDCERKPVVKTFAILFGTAALLVMAIVFFPPFEKFLLIEWLKEENFM